MAHDWTPQPPLQEDYGQLVIRDCVTQREVDVVPHDRAAPARRVAVDVMRSVNPTEAYVRIQSRRPISLDHHFPGWGEVYFAVVYRFIAPGLLEEPASQDAAEYVAIKRLCKSVVQDALERGLHENPYKEMLRMQTIGDNIHVLSDRDCLQDDTHLYIVMPYCEESLVDCIPWTSQAHGGLPEGEARNYFNQILQNINYLRQHNICHRDLSPDNCMIYQGRIVFTDLAMSFRMPDAILTTKMGFFGKRAYLPPEVWVDLPFEALKCDVWACAVILFNLLTGEILYEEPRSENLRFRYFILARGVSDTPSNERTAEALMELEGQGLIPLLNTVHKVMALSEEVLELLGGMLHLASAERYNFERIHGHAWIRQDHP